MPHVLIEWNDKTAILRGLHGEGLRAVKGATSYRKEGMQFSRRWREQKWTGYVHLLKWNAAANAHTLPAGLIPDVLFVLGQVEWTVAIEDKRTPLPARREFGWGSATLRPYQKKAVAAFVSGNGNRWRAGRGILKHSIRSGKTTTSAAVVEHYGQQTLFIVTSQILLRQAQAVLGALLPRATIGVFGDTEHDTDQDVIVATAHALVKARKAKSPAWKKLRKRPVLVCDEAHHLDSAEWYKTAIEILARVRLGLTATVWFSEDKEPDAEDVLLKAATGAVLDEVTMADLVAQGYLMRGEIRLRRVRSPSLWGVKWSQALYNDCIYDNTDRIALIVEEVARCALTDGLRTLVTTNRVSHAHAITDALLDRGVRATFLIGEHDDARRAKVVRDLCARKLDAIVSTVLSEGVDIPECEAVVVGEGGKSRRAALQRMRCLTPAEGKTRAVFVDFVDQTNDFFAKHSMARLTTYRAEGAFDFVVVPE